MRYLRAICRFAVGIVFILSGFLKAIDPIGNSLKIDEYLGAFHLGFMDFISLPAGILLAAAEFLIGACILKGIKIRLFSLIALIFISFFTLLTLYSAIFNPVQDCGCFGEAIHLSNWETFFKNLVLLGCITVIYLQRDKFLPIATPRWKYIYIGGYSTFILGISIYALMFLPQMDFGIFKSGTNLVSSALAQPEHEYETVFIYAKDGKEQIFTLDNLPDSTWSYVSTDTKLISASSYTQGNAELILRNRDRIYVTDEILGSDKPVFMLSVYKNKKVTGREIGKIMAIRDSVLSAGAVFYILSGISPEELDGVFASTAMQEFLIYETLYTDYKSVLSLNRSNLGLTYINNGTVVSKWSKSGSPSEFSKLLDEDPEVVSANITIKEHLFAEITLLFILFLVAIIRFISRRIYNKKTL